MTSAPRPEDGVGSAAQTTPDGKYALFPTRNTTNAYDENLTRRSHTAISSARSGYAAANAGNYTLFAGGAVGIENSDIVDAYDLFLTRTTPMALSKGRYRPIGATFDGFAMFAGGEEYYTWNQGNVQAVAGIEVYDAYLVRTTVHDSLMRTRAAAGAIGEFALFAGGVMRGSSVCDEVYAYCRA